MKKYPKKRQPNIQQRKINLFLCPSCKKNIWLELDGGFSVRIENLILLNRSIILIKKVLKQDHYILTRLNYANKK